MENNQPKETNNTKTLLRWIGVLPAAGLSSMLISVVYGLFNWLCSFMNLDNPDGKLVAHAIAGWAYIFTGYYVAPHHKTQTGFTLYGIIFIISCYFITLSFRFNDFAPLLQLIIFNISCIGTILYLHKNQ